MTQTKKIAVIKNQSAISQNSAEALIAQAIEKNIPVDVMERLLAMRTQVKAEQAKEAYYEAMANFQNQCPIIQKTKVVMNKDGKTVRYKYAPIDSIIEQVKEFIKQNGFSYSINTKMNDGITITCQVTHKLGHSEISEFSVPIEKDAYMNDQQKVAAASTFAKRYAFCNAFGILTGDEDNDTTSIKPKITLAPAKNISLVDLATPEQIKNIKDGLFLINGNLENLENKIKQPITKWTAKQATAILKKINDKLDAIPKTETLANEQPVAKFQCQDCGKDINSGVKLFSEKRYGLLLCMVCKAKHQPQ